MQFAVCERKERKVWSQPALCRKRVKIWSLSKISARWGKWFEYWVQFACWVERKACSRIVLWILISLLQCDHIIIPTMMRFVMTFDTSLMIRCVTAPVLVTSKFIVLNFHFYWYCLSLKANFQKKNICGNPSTKGFLGLLNQVLAFVMFFS